MKQLRKLDPISNVDFKNAIKYVFIDLFQESANNSPENKDLYSYIVKYLNSELMETDAEKQLIVLMILESDIDWRRMLKYFKIKADELNVRNSKFILDQVKEEGLFTLQMLDLENRRDLQ